MPPKLDLYYSKPMQERIFLLLAWNRRIAYNLVCLDHIAVNAKKCTYLCISIYESRTYTHLNLLLYVLLNIEYTSE